jgi:flagellar biosynthesis regulator FlbT
MALTLAFTVTERSDNKLITLTDASGTGSTGWDYLGNPSVAGINSTNNSLDLDIVRTTSDGTVTSYDTIDLHALLTSHDTTEDLVFAIDMSMLLVSAVAAGTSDDVFPDGLYAMTYTYQKGLGGDETHTDETILIDGIVKSSIYEMLRTIPTKYECGDNHERDILDIIFLKGYYDAMIATAIVGRDEQVLQQLAALEKLVLNGSNYSW